MRVLLSPLPTLSHLAPMIPVATSLQARGHDVLVAAPANYAGMVTGTGLSHLPTVEHVDMGRLIGVDRNGEVIPDPPDLRGKLIRNAKGFARAALEMAAGVDELFDTWRPDVLIGDPSEYASRFAASKRGIPVVLHEWGMPIPAETTDTLAVELAPEIAAAGPETVLFTIETLPAELTTRTGPDRQRMRFVPFNGTATIPPAVFSKGAVPRVLLTFGGIIGNHPKAAGPAADLAGRLAGEGYDVLLAVGEGVRTELSELPGGVSHVGWLPLSKVLPACDLILHHGGNGSSMTAMAIGTPQVAMPIAADQFINAECVNQIGVGVGLPMGGVLSPDDVVAAAAKVLAGPEYRQRCAEVRAGIQAQPSPLAVAELIEQRVGERC